MEQVQERSEFAASLDRLHPFPDQVDPGLCPAHLEDSSLATAEDELGRGREKPIASLTGLNSRMTEAGASAWD